MTANTPDARRAAVQRAYAVACTTAYDKLHAVTGDAFAEFDAVLADAQTARDIGLALIPDGQPAVDSTTEGTPTA